MHRLIVEDRLPGQSTVQRFPDAAGGGAQVDDVRVRDDGFHVGDPPAHAGGPDGAGPHAGQQLGVDLGVEGGGVAGDQQPGRT